MIDESLTLTIVIPAYNEQDYLKSCLESIADQTVRPQEVIVVDNGSSDKTSEIAAKFPFVKLMREPRRGRSFAQNTGFDAAESSIIGRLDADTRLEPDWVASVLEYFGDHPGVSAVTGVARFYDFPFRRLSPALHNILYRLSQKIIAGTEVLWGANMAIRSKDWKKISHKSQFDNRIDEDIAISLYMKKLGLKIERVPTMRVGVSMRRGDMGFISTIRYLSTWPRNYWLYHLYARGLIISLLAGVIVLLGVPLYIWSFFQKDLDRAAGN